MGSVLNHCHTLSCGVGGGGGGGGGTSKARGQWKRYFNLVSIGLACSRMLTIL